VFKRVRTRVAVGVRVGQGADPAGVDHDDKRAAASLLGRVGHGARC
jgi:antitoxin Phd